MSLMAMVFLPSTFLTGLFGVIAGTDTAKTESKTAQAQMLILELLADGKRMPSAELEKAVNERGISSRTMRTAKSITCQEKSVDCKML